MLAGFTKALKDLERNKRDVTETYLATTTAASTAQNSNRLKMRP